MIVTCAALAVLIVLAPTLLTMSLYAFAFLVGLIAPPPSRRPPEEGRP